MHIKTLLCWEVVWNPPIMPISLSSFAAFLKTAYGSLAPCFCPCCLLLTPCFFCSCWLPQFPLNLSGMMWPLYLSFPLHLACQIFTWSVFAKTSFSPKGLTWLFKIAASPLVPPISLLCFSFFFITFTNFRHTVELIYFTYCLSLPTWMKASLGQKLLTKCLAFSKFLGMW